MLILRTTLLPLGLILVGLPTTLVAGSAQAVMYAGPEYDRETGTGYSQPYFPVAPGGNTTSGMAIASFRKEEAYSFKGQTAIRWHASGTITFLQALSTIDVATDSFPYAINPSGTVVGRSDKVESGNWIGMRAVRWDVSGAVTELGNLGTDNSGKTHSYAHDINAAGTSVGYASKYESGSYIGTRAVRWDASGTAATELERLGNIGSSVANAISANGIVVGYADKFVSNFLRGTRAVRWDASGIATELEALGTDSSGSTDFRATAVNASGVAIGWGKKYNMSNIFAGERAVRWDASSTVAVELGNLGTNSSGVTNTRAVAINSSGTAAGYLDKYESGISKGRRAVRWDGFSSVATELGNLGTNTSGVTDTYAVGINSAGIAVGRADVYKTPAASPEQRAVMWGLDGVAINLSTFITPYSGWTYLSEARTISDDNWISGTGIFDPDGSGFKLPYQRTFLMQIPHAGDANTDGAVNSIDFVLLASSYGKSSNVTFTTGDFNLDGKVNTLDFNILAGNFNSTPASVLGTVLPEPAGLWVATIGCVLILNPKRR